jgi:Flp pilus assembly pilin Flp
MEALRNRVLKGFVRIRESRKGQGFVEYIMIVGLIGIALAAALGAFKDQVSTALSTVGAGV